MSDVVHLDRAALGAGLEHVRGSPSDHGLVEMIVARPSPAQRRVLDEGVLSVEDGLVGDGWRARGSRWTDDGSAHPEMQLTLVNSRFLALIAGDRSRWPLAGDQLVVDLDLSTRNLQVDDRLRIGEAVVQVTPVPHTGCKKFTGRFGVEAVRFANGPAGKELRLRGLYTRVLQPGVVRVGDVIRKEPAPRA